MMKILEGYEYSQTSTERRLEICFFIRVRITGSLEDSEPPKAMRRMKLLPKNPCNLRARKRVGKSGDSEHC